MICEYCGHEHDVRELCGARQAMSRRRFFSLSARAIVGAAIAPQIIDAAQALIAPPLTGLRAVIADAPSGIVYGIDRATFKFWRNQQIGATALDGDVEAFRRIFNECTRGVDA